MHLEMSSDGMTAEINTFSGSSDRNVQLLGVTDKVSSMTPLPSGPVPVRGGKGMTTVAVPVGHTEVHVPVVGFGGSLGVGMGMDLEGDEPGEVSKCILAVWIAYGVGRSMYMLYTQFSGFVGRKQF